MDNIVLEIFIQELVRGFFIITTIVLNSEIFAVRVQIKFRLNCWFHCLRCNWIHYSRWVWSGLIVGFRVNPDGHTNKGDVGGDALVGPLLYDRFLSSFRTGDWLNIRSENYSFTNFSPGLLLDDETSVLLLWRLLPRGNYAGNASFLRKLFAVSPEICDNRFWLLQLCIGLRFDILLAGLVYLWLLLLTKYDGWTFFHFLRTVLANYKCPVVWNCTWKVWRELARLLVKRVFFARLLLSINCLLVQLKHTIRTTLSRITCKTLFLDIVGLENNLLGRGARVMSFG